jgi:hypothetical protein
MYANQNTGPFEVPLRRAEGGRAILAPGTPAPTEICPRRDSPMLQARAAQCNELWREFGIEIARRGGEQIYRRGFMEIRERDGPGSEPRDARNRLGRPKRKLI